MKMSQQISIQLLGGRATLWNSPNGLMLSDWYMLLVQPSSVAAERVFSIVHTASKDLVYIGLQLVAKLHV